MLQYIQTAASYCSLPILQFTIQLFPLMSVHRTYNPHDNTSIKIEYAQRLRVAHPQNFSP